MNSGTKRACLASLAAAAGVLSAAMTVLSAGNVTPPRDPSGPATTLMRRCLEVDQPFAQFGVAVSRAGDVNGDGYDDVIITANGYDNGERDEGRVFVYYGYPLGIRVQADWTADGRQAAAMLGCAVSAAGDVNGDGYGDIITGASSFNGPEGQNGLALVFLGSEPGLNQDPDWTCHGDQRDGQFAAAVSGAGDVNGDGFADVIIGAPYHDDAVGDEGRVFAYYGSKDGLRSEPDWTVPGDRAGAYFGCAICAAGDVNGDGYDDIAVGASGRGESGRSPGAVLVYPGSHSGLGHAPAWLLDGHGSEAGFGAAVAPAGDVNGDGFDDIVVGARLDSKDLDSEGRVFVYHGSPAGIGSVPDWTGEGGQVRAEYGRAVASAGDVNGDGYDDIVIGAVDYDGQNVDEGRVLVYCGSKSGLGASPVWVMEGGQVEAYLGCAVAGAGDVDGDGFDDVLAGAWLYDGGEQNEGRAWVFFGGREGPEAREYWRAEGNHEDANLGVAAAPAGDVNGDGYGDVIVGAPAFENGEEDEGLVAVYEGSPHGLETSPAWFQEGSQISAGLGRSVASAGDVNGDGFGDVIAGAPLYDLGETDEGRAYVYLGSPAGLAGSASWIGESGEAEAWYGGAVSSAGDVNGDGFGDIVVGAPGCHGGRGRAYVHHGSASGLHTAADWSVQGEHPSAAFGGSVAAAGDVNGDGFGDLIVGATGYSIEKEGEGRVFLYLGSPPGLRDTAAWTAGGGRAAARFGACVAGAGDINGDGYDDVIIGASRYEEGQIEEGAAFLFLGCPDGLNPEPAWTGGGGQAYALFGCSVASAGDVDNDGFADVIVGAYGFDSGGRADLGRVDLYRGSRSGLVSLAAWSALGGQEGGLFGYPVSGAGDVNGDGFDDLIVGSERYTRGKKLEGAAFVFYTGSAARKDGRGGRAKTTESSQEDQRPLPSGYGSPGAP